MIKHVQVSPLLKAWLFRNYLERDHSKSSTSKNCIVKLIFYMISQYYLKVRIIEWASKASTPRHTEFCLIVSIYRITERISITVCPSFRDKISNFSQILSWRHSKKVAKDQHYVDTNGIELESLSKVSSSDLVDWKNVVGRGDSTKGNQSGSLIEISH